MRRKLLRPRQLPLGACVTLCALVVAPACFGSSIASRSHAAASVAAHKLPRPIPVTSYFVVPKHCNIGPVGNAIPAHPTEADSVPCAGDVWEKANGYSNFGWPMIRHAVTPAVYHELTTDHADCFFPGPGYFPTAYVSFVGDHTHAVVSLSGWGTFDLKWGSSRWVITRVPRVQGSGGCGPTP